MLVKIFLGILASCAFGIFAIWALDKYRKLKFSQYIKGISERYQEVISLNKQYTFFRLRPDQSKAFFARSKREFDTFDFDQRLLSLMRRETAYFDELLYAAGNNKRNLRSYFDALEICSPPIDRKTAKHYGVEYRQAAKEEERLIHDILPNPVTSFTFSYVLKYYCPVEEADMEAVKVYTLEEIQQFRKKVNKKWPTQVILTDIPRRPGMWRLAKLQCVYDSTY